MQDSEEGRSHAWFFRSHSPAELKEWTARMRFFRFYRAVGGQANDGDTLQCALSVSTESELIALTSALQINLLELPADERQLVTGQQYTIAELRRFRRRMESFPRFEQLGRIRLAAVECFASVWDSRMELRLSGAAGDPYEVSEEDVPNAIQIERLLIPFADKVIPPAPDDKRCFLG